jgi:hypothetical protein
MKTNPILKYIFGKKCIILPKLYLIRIIYYIYFLNKYILDKTIENQIKNYFESSKILSIEELMGLLRNDFPSYSDNTLKAYIYNFKKEGVINNLSRGIYTIEKTATFNPNITPQLKKIAARIHKTYPFINYCVWESSWLNDLMRHQPFKNFAIVEVEKIATEQVFNDLNNNFSNVYINPDTSFFDRYISVLDNVVIVKNLNSEAPTLKLKELTIPTLEKILVDILIDDNLFAAQQGELDFIFKSAFDKYDINESKMKRYAARRSRETQLENILNISLAK